MSTAVEQTEAQDLAGLFRALGDETRVRIVSLLSRGELCVCHIEEALECPQSTISRHLAVLRASRLVTTRREGAWVYYALAQDSSPQVVAQLLSVVNRYAVPPIKKPRRSCK